MKNTITLVDGEASVDLNDPWELVLNQECSGQYCVEPSAIWLSRPASDRGAAVLIEQEQELHDIQPYLQDIRLVALMFKDFKDGRAYSLAYLLRTRFGYKGELRAVGEVLRDQLSLMRQCGFTSFAIKEGKDPYDALKGIKGLSVTYSSSVSSPSPLFRRVRRY
ncbi:DUF934 domain-containing protein [Marinomonas gallaica]|uniref:DUF934 domain-containing protein n=1 Tax=Marinomonas gallaica TaxID=1806667 RepID=UPI003CE49E8C